MGWQDTRAGRIAVHLLACAALALRVASATAGEFSELSCSSEATQPAPEEAGDLRVIVPDGAKPRLSPADAAARANQGVQVGRTRGSVREVSCAEFFPANPGTPIVSGRIPTWVIRARGSFSSSGPNNPAVESGCRSEEALARIDDDTGWPIGIELLGATTLSPRGVDEARPNTYEAPSCQRVNDSGSSRPQAATSDLSSVSAPDSIFTSPCDAVSRTLHPTPIEVHARSRCGGASGKAFALAS
jgi:hypothetical protein